MAYWRRFYTDLQAHSEVVCYSALDLVGTKDLKKELAGRASKSKSKSKSIAFKFKFKSESLEPKSKSSKNGLKSGLKSEYYKSGNQSPPKHVIQCKKYGDTPKNVFSKAWQEKWKK